MVRAWIYDEDAEGDQTYPHMPTPFGLVDQSQLDKLGVLHWKISPKDVESNPDAGAIGEIRKLRGYKNHDFITIDRTKLANYDEKLKVFFAEHLHEDEEIRFVLEGSGYFDVRDDTTGSWIRIETLAGDMIVLPEGLYHRFTPDRKEFLKAMRLFKDAPRWEAINRGAVAESTASRRKYLDFIKKVDNDLSSPSNAYASPSPAPPSSSSSSSSSSSTTAAATRVQAQFSNGVNGTSVVLKDHAAALAHYPHARSYGGLIYVSGLSSRRSDNSHRGVTVSADNSNTVTLDIVEQTRGVLDNMKLVLSSFGATLDHVIDLTVFLVDMKDYAAFNQVYNEYFSNASAGPSRTTVAVKQLPHPNLLIEIKAVSVAPQQ